MTAHGAIPRQAHSSPLANTQVGKETCAHLHDPQPPVSSLPAGQLAARNYSSSAKCKSATVQPARSMIHQLETRQRRRRRPSYSQWDRQIPMVGSVELSSATAPLLTGPWLSRWLRRHGALCAWRPPSWCRSHVDGDDGESFRSFWLAFFRANCKAKLPGVESWTKYDPLPDWWWSAELVLYERMPFSRLW